MKIPNKILKRFLLISLFLSVRIFAQFSNVADSLIRKGIDEIYSMKFVEAYATFDELKRLEPKNPAGKFFDAMTLWWQILVDLRQTRFDELFYSKLDDVIEQCDEILDDDPNNYVGLFFKAGALGFRGRLLSIRQEWLDAALDGKDALPLVLRVSELYPDDVDIKLGTGLYNYFAVVIPKVYPFVKPLMTLFPPGDKELGLRQLTAVADSGKYAKYETQYFLVQLYFEFEKNNERALYYVNRLIKKFPDNPKFENFLARIYFRTRQFEKADSIFHSIKSKIAAEKTGYDTKTNTRSTYYYLGAIAYRNFGKTDEAIDYFKRSLAVSDEIDGEDYSGFMRHTYKYLIKLYRRKGNKAEAKRYEDLLEERFDEKL